MRSNDHEGGQQRPWRGPRRQRLIELCFQSQVGPVKWLSYDDVLNELGAAGLKNLVVVPLSFVSSTSRRSRRSTLSTGKLLRRQASPSSSAALPQLGPAVIECLADMTTDALKSHRCVFPRHWTCIRRAKSCQATRGSLASRRQQEQTNGRIAMLALASIAVSQVLKSGCPKIDGPAIASEHSVLRFHRTAGAGSSPPSSLSSPQLDIVST